jgi:altronate hydrolase
VRAKTLNQMPRALLLNMNDNVAVATKPLAEDERLEIPGVSVTVAEAIPVGHKVSIRGIAKGESVIKYGEVIGRATAPIDPGRHVHIHNLESVRLPGESR